MEISLPNVTKTRDGGEDCWDTTISARDIARLMDANQLVYDPEHQRGINSVTGKPMLNGEKVERWANDLLADTAIFGQLTWNFRPDDATVLFDPDSGNQDHGKLIFDGPATLPDSWHRHNAIARVMASIARGSQFDPNRRFSLRIWNVSIDGENRIFHAMNQEHDKADATRSKYLSPRGPAQQIAFAVMKQAPELQDNVEVVSNNLSIKNHRLMAFNTLSTAFERFWDDVDEDAIEEIVPWFLAYWAKLVTVLPELGKVSVAKRQLSKKTSLVSWAVSIHGYVALARRFYNESLSLELLDKLATPGVFDFDDPVILAAGIVVPSVNKKGEATKSIRNSHQSRRAMAAVLAAQCGLSAEPNTIEIEEPDGSVTVVK